MKYVPLVLVLFTVAACNSRGSARNLYRQRDVADLNVVLRLLITG